jgi:hypothetical protein
MTPPNTLTDLFTVGNSPRAERRNRVKPGSVAVSPRCLQLVQQRQRDDELVEERLPRRRQLPVRVGVQQVRRRRLVTGRGLLRLHIRQRQHSLGDGPGGVFLRPAGVAAGDRQVPLGLGLRPARRGQFVAGLDNNCGPLDAFPGGGGQILLALRPVPLDVFQMVLRGRQFVRGFPAVQIGRGDVPVLIVEFLLRAQHPDAGAFLVEREVGHLLFQVP